MTGDRGIHYACKNCGIKTIEIDSLNPVGRVLKTEHMTSLAGQYNNMFECMTMVITLENVLKKLGVQLTRTKIECPATPDYFDKYINTVKYVESHFNMMGVAAVYPTSVNKAKVSERMGIDRLHKPTLSELIAFKKKWYGSIVELCLYDTNPDADNEWFDSWRIKSV